MHKLIKLVLTEQQKIHLEEIMLNEDFIYDTWYPEVDNIARYWMYEDGSDTFTHGLVDNLRGLQLGDISVDQLNEAWPDPANPIFNDDGDGREESQSGLWSELTCPLVDGFDFDGIAELYDDDVGQSVGFMCHSEGDGSALECTTKPFAITFIGEDGDWYLLFSTEHAGEVRGLFHPVFSDEEIDQIANLHGL